MFNRQVTMREDGTLTDVPSCKTEKPRVKQLDFLAVIDRESFNRLAAEDSGELFNKEAIQ